MSTLAGQLFTKKIVVGDPAARSYLFVSVLLPYRSAILGQLWKGAATSDSAQKQLTSTTLDGTGSTEVLADSA